MLNLSPWGLTPATLACALPGRRVEVNATQLIGVAKAAAADGARLAALWAADERDLERGFCVRILLQEGGGVLEGAGALLLLEHRVPTADSRYPDLSSFFPSAGRMQRSAYDLTGIAADADDQRPWSWMAAWPIDQFPLRHDFVAQAKWEPGQEDYPFVRVQGDGVHEIPVGPVHAGIIEPGHFRFQIVGEKVLRLEERLGWVHKGIEKRFESMSIAAGYRLAGRVSGDSTVAYAWAYAQAAESLCATAPPPRALWLRALALERERIANHLGDLGYLGNDGGFAFGLAQFSRLKEDVLRANAAAFGHRFAMDFIVPGGVACDVSAQSVATLVAQGETLEREVGILRDIYGDHAGLQDRFRACGRVPPSLAATLGLVGFAGRASGQAQDLRCDLPVPPWTTMGVRKAAASEGDVAARVAVRFAEVAESLRLIRLAADALAAPDVDGAWRVDLPDPPPSRVAVGAVEGWRGPVFVALESGPRGMIRRCHPHDPSWSNWPVLEHAVIGNIVPDFPLINKSFNLSYSGHDL